MTVRLGAKAGLRSIYVYILFSTMNNPISIPPPHFTDYDNFLMFTFVLSIFRVSMGYQPAQMYFLTGMSRDSFVTTLTTQITGKLI